MPIPSRRGFTLIETVIATGVLAVASVALATLFISSIKANSRNAELTQAHVLLWEKLEEFRATSLLSTAWTVGGGLLVPTTGYFEYVGVGSGGSIQTSTTDSSMPFLRLWQITGAKLRSVTVVVYATPNRSAGRGLVELARATSVVGAKW
jgi:prepilin-type N-terminal cleavage/methylation domain-containing protein